MRFCSFFLMVMIIFLTSACSENVNTEKEFQPYIYKYPITEIKKNYSEEILMRGEEELLELNRVNSRGNYKPNLGSLDKHQTPEWYLDARLSGKIPPIQVDLLEELGEWLDINGEAIYTTRPYEITADNTQLGQPVWYTMSKDSIWAYAIVLDWPNSETFICSGANPVWGSDVYMLGYDTPLEWVDTGRELWGMSAKIPRKMLLDPSERPSKYAWVLKFKYDKRNQYGK